MAASYTRQLEDACLALWERMDTPEFVRLRKEAPDLADFLAHLRHSMSAEEAMVRRNVWLGHPDSDQDA